MKTLSNYNRSFSLYLLLAFSIFIAAYFSGGEVIGNGHYLALNTLLESMTVLISFMLYVTVWNFRFDIKDDFILFNGIIFLAIGVIDMLHIFSHQGMPILITEGSLQKSLLLWIFSRLVATLGILGAVCAMLTKRHKNLNVVLHYSFTILFIILGLVLTTNYYWINTLRVYVDESSKIISSGMILLNCVTALTLYNKRRLIKPDVLYRLFLFLMLASCSDATIVYYGYESTGIHLYSQLFKLFAYYQVYLAVYRDGILENHLLSSTVSRLSRNILRPETTLEQTGEYIADAFMFHLKKPDRLSFYIKRDENSFILLASKGAYSEVIKPGAISRPLFSIKEFNKSVVVDDLDKVAMPNLEEGNNILALIKTKIKEVMFVPLTSEDELHGFIIAYNFSKDKNFDIEDSVSADSLASFATLALLHAKVVTLMQEFSFEDALTKLNNRRYFMEKLNEVLYDSGRYNNTFSLVVIDMDGMKYINDNYGHQAGDEALRKIALFLKDTFRETDVIARFGGDEFGVIVKNSSRKQTELKMGHLQQQLLSYTLDACQCPLSISYGVAEYLIDGSDKKALIKIADDRMYEQKDLKKTRTARNK